MDYKKFRQAKAIEASNKKKLLKVNPKLDEGTGIYILWRTETHGYIGQSVKLLTRLAQHMSGYEQHIDRSMKAHGLYSEENKNGYKIDFFHCPVSQLDEKEREYIQKAIDSGWIVKTRLVVGRMKEKKRLLITDRQKDIVMVSNKARKLWPVIYHISLIRICKLP